MAFTGIVIVSIVSNSLNDLNHRIDALSHLKTTTTNTTRVINHYNSTTTTTIIYLNSTTKSTNPPNPPPPTTGSVYLQNVATWGNKTCTGTIIQNPFIFNMTATIVNTTPNSFQAEVLFQLDNATKLDRTYTVPASSSINIKFYQPYNYYQFTVPQDFEIVLMNTATQAVIETVRLR